MVVSAFCYKAYLKQTQFIARALQRLFSHIVALLNADVLTCPLQLHQSHLPKTPFSADIDIKLTPSSLRAEQVRKL